ncbi:hypothetical protein [Saccharothrix obliqua]|uniref:hypothetical protein n=1 Tax=Saccharothrix obliqua TaxID=2861747 RepID=UPI001C5F95D5|nr:hypothetical protein [Saccharothrix obliqua]MBW4720233.1 hypothetical protein [Saccharothrix obliqua]
MFPAAPYDETIHYLRLMSGPFERDPQALRAALELLLLLRARWKAQLETYATIRRIEKRRGVRKPRGTTPFGGPVDAGALFHLHTPQGAERYDVHHLLPAGRTPRFAGASFVLSAPDPQDDRASEPLAFDGRSFELAATPAHLFPPDQRPSSWPEHHPNSRS